MSPPVLPASPVATSSSSNSRGFTWSRHPPSLPMPQRPVSAASLHFHHTPSPHLIHAPNRPSSFSTCSSDCVDGSALPSLPVPAGTEWCVLQSGSNTPYGEVTPRTLRRTPHQFGRSPTDGQQGALLNRLVHAMEGRHAAGGPHSMSSLGEHAAPVLGPTPVLGSAAPLHGPKQHVWRAASAARRE